MKLERGSGVRTRASKQPPEIVGQVRNPVLETLRRLWWRLFDRACDSIVVIRLSVRDRMFGPDLD